jgi:hypothetical protein
MREQRSGAPNATQPGKMFESNGIVCETAGTDPRDEEGKSFEMRDLNRISGMFGGAERRSSGREFCQ